LPVTFSSREVAPGNQHCSRGVSVRIKSVSIAFAGRTVLENFDIEIFAGQFVAIVGRSGCGKSTLLRSVVGLETPQTGTITVGNVTEHAGKPDVRVMFQDSRLLPWRRILPNVMLGSRRREKFWRKLVCRKEPTTGLPPYRAGSGKG
jgi:sulfonate transport system ATP-binding protein